MNVRGVLKRIERIEDEIVPKPKDDLVMVWSFGPDDEPHGKYGYRKLHLHTGEIESCTEEEELELLREAYDAIPLEARKRTRCWSSFENFLEYRRCKCPAHKTSAETQAAEIKRLLREYDDVLEKVAKRNIEARERELLKISFHTFRHWAATMLYHKTKDPLLVKEFLGHQKLDTTLLYIQIEQALFKETSAEFTVKVAKNPNEVKALLEVGFEYVCEKDDLMFFRKRK